MEIKYKWEEKGIKAGNFVIRCSYKGSKDLGFASTVAYKIGFATLDNKQVMCLTSITDGLTLIFKGTKIKCTKELEEKFNNDRWGYRPLQGEELITLLTHTVNSRKSDEIKL